VSQIDFRREYRSSDENDSLGRELLQLRRSSFAAKKSTVKALMEITYVFLMKPCDTFLFQFFISIYIYVLCDFDCLMWFWLFYVIFDCFMWFLIVLCDFWLFYVILIVLCCFLCCSICVLYVVLYVCCMCSIYGLYATFYVLICITYCSI